MMLSGWPGFRLVSRGKRHVWEGTLRPTPLSQVYTVKISYADWENPKVLVINPVLEPRADGSIPHRYGDESLCLYVPGQWTRANYISEAIIPWTVLWLYHYEIWRVTGEWLGGGVHPLKSSTESPHP